MSVWVWIGVALLSGLAALARFLLVALVSARAAGTFPLGSFVVNITGALLLGLVTGLAVEGEGLVLIGTATLGSYTTFSTWMLETERLSGGWRTARRCVQYSAQPRGRRWRHRPWARNRNAHMMETTPSRQAAGG